MKKGYMYSLLWMNRRWRVRLVQMHRDGTVTVEHIYDMGPVEQGMTHRVPISMLSNFFQMALPYPDDPTATDVPDPTPVIGEIPPETSQGM